MTILTPPSRSELHRLFGPINYSPSLPPPNNKPYWAYESKFMELMPVPAAIAGHLINSTTKRATTTMYINKVMREPLLRAFSNLVAVGVEKELRTFDGAFNIRKVRGDDSTLSTHAYGLAVDFNALDNPLGGESTWSNDFIKCFTHEGFVWGGDFKRKDPMHLQWVREEGEK